MKQQIKQFVEQAIKKCQEQNVIDINFPIDIQIERARHKDHGDFACNIALILAKKLKMNPRTLAEKIIDFFPVNEMIEKTNIAGPGFINFYLKNSAYKTVITDVLKQKADYGRINLGQGKRVLLEFVSANPTGPLHVGHGRSAAFGGALADLLETVGYKVHREYYVNDAGRQMHILTASIWLRYIQAFGETIQFPKNGYKGQYVIAMASHLKEKYNKKFYYPVNNIYEDIPLDESDDQKEGDKEAHIDALIERAKTLLGKENYQIIFDYCVQTILDGIRDDLELFGVQYQEWFKEKILHQEQLITKAIEALKASEHTYERNGAVWFRSTDFKDDKDRVLIRENGQPTYFAADAAYHWHKYNRNFDQIINIFGSDHHGYIPRLNAVISALGKDLNSFIVITVQFAVLFRGKEKVQMSTRSGEFITLRALCNEVGKDAARFFYVMRKPEQHMDFDLELAKSQTLNNPVYYIQYAHARISSVFRQLKEKGLSWDQTDGMKAYSMLTNEHEKELLTILSRYVETIEIAANQHDPHMIAHYLRELADVFHSYYNAHQFLIEDNALRHARLNLIAATQQIIKNGLKILGVSAPEVM